jgi:hypothetical protein
LFLDLGFVLYCQDLFLVLANSSASLRSLASSTSGAGLDSGSASPWVSRAERLGSTSTEDDAPLVELTVVLFFLADILGLILEPNTNGGRQLLWGKPQLSHTNNEGKTKAQELKPKRGTKDSQKLFF